MTAGTAEAAVASRSGAIRAGNIEGPREETSLLAFFAILFAHRRLIALSALAGTILFGVLAIAEAKRYESRASFIVKGAQTPVSIPGTATSLGFALTAYADFAQSVVFYSDLSAANVILRSAAEDSYATSESRGVKRPLPELLGVKTKNRELALDRAVAKLSENVSSSINTRSGVVSISVTSSDPLLAQELGTKILAEIEAWSKAKVHDQAQRERRFVEGLAGEARARLSQAENSLSTFLSTNLVYNAPDLALEHNRLQREVEMRQQVYTALSQSLEQAKIEEGRDRSAINIVEVADLPVEPQRIAALRETIIGLAVGLLAGIVLAFLRQRLEEKKLVAA